MNGFPPRVGVVLLNWNTGEFTIPCIESLLAGDAKPWRILVFDNGSADGSPDRIARQFPDVLLLRSPTNLGFTGGNNRGIERLLADGAEAVWILNNDTLVAPDCLARLLRAWAAEPGVGAVTGKILYEQPPDRIWYAGGSVSRRTFAIHHWRRGEDDGGPGAPACDVEFVTGCSMLVPAEALRRVGGFHPAFENYYEDLEWCLRARALGYCLRYEPSAVLRHRISASMSKNQGKFSPRFLYLISRNRLFTARLHASGGAPVALTAAVLLWRAATFGWYPSRARRERAGAILRGVRDGLRGRLDAASRGP